MNRELHCVMLRYNEHEDMHTGGPEFGCTMQYWEVMRYNVKKWGGEEQGFYYKDGELNDYKKFSGDKDGYKKSLKYAKRLSKEYNIPIKIFR